MATLLLLPLAFAGGVLTVLAPCSLPVLPFVLGTATGDRLRTAGVALGFAATVLPGAVVLASPPAATGIRTSVARTVAVLALGVFGLVLIVPALGSYAERAAARRLTTLPSVIGGPTGTGAPGRGLGVGLAVGA